MHVVVEALNQTHSERIKFYLTKADTAGSDSDRQVSLHLPLEVFYIITFI